MTQGVKENGVGMKFIYIYILSKITAFATSLFLLLLQPPPPPRPHYFCVHHNSCTLWNGNQAASNCNNWKNVLHGLFEHLLGQNVCQGCTL